LPFAKTCDDGGLSGGGQYHGPSLQLSCLQPSVRDRRVPEVWSARMLRGEHRERLHATEERNCADSRQALHSQGGDASDEQVDPAVACELPSDDRRVSSLWR
jgi:hypothetical protein